MCFDSCHKTGLGRAAPTTARRRWGIGHEKDEHPRRKPARATERQLKAVPDEPEEQHVDVLQVFPHRFWR